MLKLMSRFMIQVLPPAFATFIGGFLLTTYHYYFMSPSTPIVTPRLGVIEPVPPPPGGVSQLVDAAHASVPEQPRPGPVAERKPIIDPKPEPRAEDGRPEPKADSKPPEPKADSRPEPKADSKPEPKAAQRQPRATPAPKRPRDVAATPRPEATERPVVRVQPDYSRPLMVPTAPDAPPPVVRYEEVPPAAPPMAAPQLVAPQPLPPPPMPAPQLAAPQMAPPPLAPPQPAVPQPFSVTELNEKLAAMRKTYEPLPPPPPPAPPPPEWANGSPTPTWDPRRP